MNQKEEDDPLLPEWVAEHAAGVRHLSQSETVLKELIADHASLTRAILYWEGKSEEKVAEFRYLEKALRSEIAAMLCIEGIEGVRLD